MGEHSQRRSQISKFYNSKITVTLTDIFLLNREFALSKTLSIYEAKRNSVGPETHRAQAQCTDLLFRPRQQKQRFLAQILMMPVVYTIRAITALHMVNVSVILKNW